MITARMMIAPTTEPTAIPAMAAVVIPASAAGDGTIMVEVGVGGYIGDALDALDALDAVRDLAADHVQRYPLY